MTERAYSQYTIEEHKMRAELMGAKFYPKGNEYIVYGNDDDGGEFFDADTLECTNFTVRTNIAWVYRCSPLHPDYSPTDEEDST